MGTRKEKRRLNRLVERLVRFIESAATEGFLCKKTWWCLLEQRERFIYGVIQRGSEPVRCKARLDTKTNRVQFVLWKAGEQGHEEDYWHNMGCGWENHFKPNAEISGGVAVR